MSVLIRGMEMPKSCQDCPLNYDQMACIVTGTRWWSDTIVITNFDSEKERLFDCPLIEVKEPHGRLIDADKFAETLKKVSIRQGYDKLFSDNILSVGDVFDAIATDLNGEGLDKYKLAPTVIEAEGSEVTE